jgi:hypothetical protein
MCRFEKRTPNKPRKKISWGLEPLLGLNFRIKPFGLAPGAARHFEKVPPSLPPASRLSSPSDFRQPRHFLELSAFTFGTKITGKS